jgi:hypothetical protein
MVYVAIYWNHLTATFFCSSGSGVYGGMKQKFCDCVLEIYSGEEERRQENPPGGHCYLGMRLISSVNVGSGRAYI